jgi:hypothetical protein
MFLGYGAYRIYQGLFRERNVFDVVNLESNNGNLQQQMYLGVFEPLNGTPYLIAAISSQQNYRQTYYDKEALSIRNFLFFDASNKTGRKLIPKTHKPRICNPHSALQFEIQRDYSQDKSEKSG